MIEGRYWANFDLEYVISIHSFIMVDEIRPNKKFVFLIGWKVIKNKRSSGTHDGSTTILEKNSVRLAFRIAWFYNCREIFEMINLVVVDKYYGIQLKT